MEILLLCCSLRGFEGTRPGTAGWVHVSQACEAMAYKQVVLLDMPVPRIAPKVVATVHTRP